LKNYCIKMVVKLLSMDFFKLLVITYDFYRKQPIFSKYATLVEQNYNTNYEH
jgi:hypothetical protein